MTVEKWKSWLESVGLVSIVASLVFVGIETRNSTHQAVLNTQALEIAAYQDLMDNIADINAIIVQDPGLASLMYKATMTSEPLTDVEQYRYTKALFMRFRHGDMAFFQYERGAIDEVRLRSALQVLDLDSPSARDFWEAKQQNFVEPYRIYINRLINEIMAEESAD